MGISRRHFLLGTGAGLILPSFYDKVVNYIDRTGEAYLQAPRTSRDLLIASFEFGDGNSWELNFGNPIVERLPIMTIREFATRYGDESGPEVWYREGWALDDAAIDWDAEMDPGWVMAFYCRQDSPNALAYRYLEKLDLGSDFNGVDSIGELKFINGPIPGSDYLGVHAYGLETLSLLQERLNQLQTGIRLELWG